MSELEQITYYIQFIDKVDGIERVRAESKNIKTLLSTYTHYFPSEECQLNLLNQAQQLSKTSQHVILQCLIQY